MKNLSFLIIFFFISLYNQQETNISKNETEDISIKVADLEEKLGKSQSKPEDSPEELQKRREENEKKFDEQVKGFLKDLGLENVKTITRNQFKSLFYKLLEGPSKEKEDEKKKEDNDDISSEDLGIMRSFATKIFDYIIKEDVEVIELEKIGDYLNPKNILNALKEILKGLGLDALVDVLSEPLMEAFGLGNNNKTNSTNNNLNNNDTFIDNNITNNTNSKEEKNYDL